MSDMVGKPEDRFPRLVANITNKHKLIKLLCFGINSHPTRSPEHKLCPEKTCFLLMQNQRRIYYINLAIREGGGRLEDVFRP